MFYIKNEILGKYVHSSIRTRISLHFSEMQYKEGDYIKENKTI